MIRFFIGAAISAAVIGAANSRRFKQFIGESGREAKKKFDYAKDYVAAIDECVKEKIGKKTKARKGAGNDK
ncbi:MAG: hypothetical protein LBP89_05630 [Helicobacteraceae bacterium]|jgi:hypothetical protein|nr:hypothetical protein [Helicobacteraceae bacterium]